jgi:flap endonuclease-1
MGIKHLNRYLLSKCSKNAIKRISLQQLFRKTVVIDAYIYIYKYLGEDRLIENMHTMVCQLLSQKIVPIFIFDGRPPEEKRDLLQQRREKRKEAESKYKWIIHQLEEGLDRTDELNSQLAVLKKQCLRVDQQHVQCVKTILRQYHVQYVDAPGESDQLCVQYVKNKRAWACLTDDMDMFVYGVARVLRDYSLDEQTVVLYTMEHILSDLHMNMRTFRQIMVLSGTDYNIDSTISLHETLKWYHEYRVYCQRKNVTMDFYDWLRRNTKYIPDYSKLSMVYAMFDI